MKIKVPPAENKSFFWTKQEFHQQETKVSTGENKKFHEGKHLFRQPKTAVFSRGIQANGPVFPARRPDKGKRTPWLFRTRDKPSNFSLLKDYPYICEKYIINLNTYQMKINRLACLFMLSMLLPAAGNAQQRQEMFLKTTQEQI